MDTNTVIEVSCVSKVFGSFAAVDNASLKVNCGDIYGFIGRNGAGKTTLMRMIAGLMRPTGGSIKVGTGKQSFAGGCGKAAAIGFLPQNVRFDDNSTAAGVIRFFAGLKGVDASKCLDFAEELGLDMGRKVKNMSPGQQRKLQIAVVTAGKPEILMLDELTAGLDPSAAQQLKEVVGRLNRQGCSVFVSSHILRELDDFCTRVAVIDKGRILYEGACEKAYELHAEGVDGEMCGIVEKETGVRLKIINDKRLVAYTDKEAVPHMLHILCERNVRVFEIRPQGLEAIYNELIGGAGI